MMNPCSDALVNNTPTTHSPVSLFSELSDPCYIYIYIDKQSLQIVKFNEQMLTLDSVVVVVIG